MFDSHAHLNDEKFNEDLEAVVRRAHEAGVEGIVNVGYDLSSSQKAVALAEEHENMYAVIGVHPHDAESFSEHSKERLVELAKHAKVVAIGETGLDYYYDNSPREVQRKVFQEHYDLARQLGKPVVIHSRDAAADTMEIVEANKGVPSLLHCYSGSLEMAQQYVAMGHYLSFAGPITFKNANRLRKVAAGVPLDKVMVETDCPYLAPIPYRGKRNEPSFVIHVAQELADLHGVDIGKIKAITRANTMRFFGIKR